MKLLALLLLATTTGCSAHHVGTFFGALGAMADGAARNADLAVTAAALADGQVPPPGYYQPVQQSTYIVQPATYYQRPSIPVPSGPQMPVQSPQFQPLSR